MKEAHPVSMPGFSMRPGTEAIILAGGLGTRLREAVPDLPKCMAPVAGRPFLYHVINYLRLQGVERFIFSLGYKHEVIETWLADHFASLLYECVIEEEPLGTGGAIHLSMQKALTEEVIVTNGDTLFRIDLPALLSLHQQQQAACTLALKPMLDFDRYGMVEINEQHRITSFHEKRFYSNGLINGGVYIIGKQQFLAQSFPAKFSFEKEYLETTIEKGQLYGLAQDNYFIDIGVPADFAQAQHDLAPAPFDIPAIDKSWTLFLDRDGVINEDKPGSYIFNAGEFVFMKGLPQAFKVFAARFGRIIVVTNQRGVGRGLMTEADLSVIHDKMIKGVAGAGGRIDAVYYCTDIHNTHPQRKPNPGMALRALHDFPEIDFSRSVIAGNNFSDMQFGRNAGMYTVFIKTTVPQLTLPHPDIDIVFELLADFAAAL